jgi:hypothetical protein
LTTSMRRSQLQKWGASLCDISTICCGDAESNLLPTVVPHLIYFL